MPTEKDELSESSDLGWLEELIEFVDATKTSPQIKRNRLSSVSVNQDVAGFSENLQGHVKFIYSEEQKKKWRANNRWKTGFRRSEEDRQKISDGHQRRKDFGFGRKPASEESNKKRSQSFKAKFAAGYKRSPVSPETKQKISRAHAERRSAGLGRKEFDIDQRTAKAKATRELNQLLGINRKPVTEETKQKLKAAWKRLKAQGYLRDPVNEVGRARMSEAQRKRFDEQGGKKHTEESKQKMRDAYALRIASGWKSPKKSAETIAKTIATRAARADLYAARAEERKKAKKKE